LLGFFFPFLFHTLLDKYRIIFTDLNSRLVKRMQSVLSQWWLHYAMSKCFSELWPTVISG